MNHSRFGPRFRSGATFLAVLCLGALALALVAAGCGSSSDGTSTTTSSGKSGESTSREPIKVASMLDKTGELEGYGKPMDEAARLAVEDINANGGVLGRELSLEDLDTRSEPARTSTVAREVARDPEVAVVMGGITSAAREAIRPVFDAAQKLYFYSVLYEGGVCDKDTFVNGPTPTQQLGPLLKWAADHGKKKWYVVAANYNFGQISAEWVESFAKQYGAQIVGGPTFFELTVSDFSSEIPKIQSSGANLIVSFLVGPAHLNFYKQWKASGLDKSTVIVSTSFGFGSEQVSLGAGGKGVLTAFPYFEQLNTPASDAFVKAWKDAGYTDTITPGAMATWNAWHLWAEGAEKAQSTDREKVIEALESGVGYDGPEGTVTIDAPSHHAIEPMRLWSDDGKGGFELVEELTPTAEPTFEQSKCNLIDEPETSEQFTP
jgi:branched-chain amino acid transport system substrate-binding protein